MADTPVDPHLALPAESATPPPDNKGVPAALPSVSDQTSQEIPQATVEAGSAAIPSPALLPPGESPINPEASPLASPMAGPLPGEPTGHFRMPGPADGGVLELAPPKPAISEAPKPSVEVPATPAVKTEPSRPWPMPESSIIYGPGWKQRLHWRRWIGVCAMLVIVALYSIFLGHYYAGAHGGVDQAGYLMTARLIAGETNPGAPYAPAKPDSASGEDKTHVPVWQGGATGYVPEEHPKPSAAQLNPKWDWLRNRLSFVPDSPFEFASRMCVMTEPFGPAVPDVAANAPNAATAGKPAEYRIFAKYPFGYSLLAALGRTISGYFEKPAKGIETAAMTGDKIQRFDQVGRGIDGMYIINPLCTVLACIFAYFMFRQAVSPFIAVIGVLWLACNPLVLIYANDANSHASTLMFVCLGFWGLLSFMRTQRSWGGWGAWVGGLSLGYACTIRYSEFLLVLPVAFAAVVNFRPTWKRASGSISLLVAWAIPILVLAFVCYVSFGSPTKTGYTYCNEDTGFGWKYFSGYWENRSMTGNWETYINQFNHLGLFMLWSLAIAGLFGMLGSAWRLGGVIALWVLPATAVYLLYYWAPGGDATTGYLRFFASIIPGMIFAAVWLLERALGSLKVGEGERGGKWAGLVMGTLLAVFLLIAAAFYAHGGPKVIDGGLKNTLGSFIEDLPIAFYELVRAWQGLAFLLIVVAATTGMWFLDRKHIAGRIGLALGAGVITAIGCAVNINTSLPSVEGNFVSWVALRQTVDNLREVLPRGSVVFSEDNLLQQLDCVGGWKLYDIGTFNPTTFAQSRTLLEQRSNRDRIIEEPNPLQSERLRFYMELLTQPSSVSTAVSLGPRSQASITQQLMKAVVDKAVQAGHRVTILVLTEPGDMGSRGAPGRRFRVPGIDDPPVDGYVTKMIRKWKVSPLPDGPDGGAGGGGNRGRGAGPARPAANPPPARGPDSGLSRRDGATYVLYELVKQPPASQPASRPGL